MLPKNLRAREIEIIANGSKGKKVAGISGVYWRQ